MSTKKRFVAYAIEHFDGTPADYAVEVYPDGEEVILDSSNPAITIEIKLEGSLDNPFERQQLCDFCDEHNVVWKDDEPLRGDVYDESDIIDCLEASSTEDVSATEAGGLVDKVKNALNGREVKKAEKDTWDLEPAWKRNEETVQRAIATRKYQEPSISEADAARYFVQQALGEKQAQTLDVLYQTKTDAKRESYSISRAVLKEEAFSGTDDKKLAKLKIQAAANVLREIKVAEKKGRLVGYSIDSAVTGDFERSGGGTEETAPDNNDELQKMWSSLKTFQEKFDFLVRVLGKDFVVGLDKSIVAWMVRQSNLFNTFGYSAIKYHKDSGSSRPIDKTVFTFLTTDSGIQSALDNGKSLSGLDLGEQTQLATIQLAQKQKRQLTELKVDKNKNGAWLSPSEMKEKYEAWKNASTSSSGAGSTAAQTDASGRTANDLVVEKLTEIAKSNPVVKQALNSAKKSATGKLRRVKK